MGKRKWSAEEKVNIILTGVKSETQVTELCRSHGILTPLCYQWRDSFSRKILVHAFLMRVRAEEVTELLQQALEKAKALCGQLPEKMFLITDNGTQFTAWQLQRYLASTPLVHLRIMYRSPNGISNMERFHKNLKYEKIYRENYSDPVEAAAEVGKYIEWYNTKRIHQVLAYLTPDRVYLHPESAKHFQPETVQET